MAVVQQWDLSLLATLGGALGDTTRFAMFEHVVTSSDPVSAGETAAVFGLHRTVARSRVICLIASSTYSKAEEMLQPMASEICG